MSQLEMFPLDHKGIPGAKWWVGNWECRNFHGYEQGREGGRGDWQFHIYGFGDDDCTVATLKSDGAFGSAIVPIDGLDRITIEGRKYGRRYWNH